jgi:1,4-dihydroxy-2-naphthoyl-CoA hydrolase
VTSHVPAEFDLALEQSGAFLTLLGIQYDSVTPTEVVAHLELSADHHTPWGIVHGGLYAAVIESIASVGGSYAVLSRGQFAVGVNNQTDFLRPAVTGRLDIRGTAVSQGRTLQLWVVELANAEGKLVSRGQVRLFNQDQGAH